MFIFSFLAICLTTLDIMSTKKGKHMPTPWYIFLMLEIVSLRGKGFFFLFKSSSDCFKCGGKWLLFWCNGIFFSHFCPFSLCIRLLTDNTHLRDVNSYLFPDNTQIYGFSLPHAARLHTLISAISEAILYGYGVET